MIRCREQRIKKCNDFIQNQINKKFVCIKEPEFIERQIKKNFDQILESNLAERPISGKEYFVTVNKVKRSPKLKTFSND